MRATSTAFSLVKHEARGRRSRPLDEQPHGLVAQELPRLERLLGVRDVERRNPEHDLARHAQRLATRREDRELRRGAQQRVREPGRRREQMLAVVQDEQQRARREEVDHRVGQRLAGQRPHVERGRDRVRDEPGVRERGELDQSRTVRVRRLDRACQLEREPRLAHTAGAGEGEQPRVAKQRFSSASSRSRPTNELASAGSGGSRAPSAGPSAAPAASSAAELRQLLPPVLDPVVVAVLRQQLAAVQRQRRAVRGRRPGTARVGSGDARAGRRRRPP